MCGTVSGLLEDLTEPRAVGETLLSALFDIMAPVVAEFLRSEKASARQLSRRGQGISILYPFN
jgi:hypothetical protein